MNEHLNVSLSDSDQRHRPAAGSFVTHLVTGRVNYYFSTKVFVNALRAVQHRRAQWSSNVRLNIIHRPLSDILSRLQRAARFAERRMLISRAVIAKMTYLFAF